MERDLENRIFGGANISTAPVASKPHGYPKCVARVAVFAPSGIEAAQVTGRHFEFCMGPKGATAVTTMSTKGPCEIWRGRRGSNPLSVPATRGNYPGKTVVVSGAFSAPFGKAIEESSASVVGPCTSEFEPCSRSQRFARFGDRAPNSTSDKQRPRRITAGCERFVRGDQDHYIQTLPH